MAVFKCKMCGGALEVTEGMSVCECEYCGTRQTLPRMENDRTVNLYDRANHFRRNNDFDKAMSIYEQILNNNPEDAESYWSIVLCRYGIEYVEDPATHKRLPTVNRAQYTSVFADEDYKSAIRYADAQQRQLYEAEAKAIDEIQKGILAISNKEKPFDVFICYKETDSNGRRTPDSVLANDLYYQLTNEGFKVFFSRITLEDKLGSAYEPYIFAALNSARVMVVLGTRPEYFNAVWVKNEWSRYLALIRTGAKKVLIPAYRDMDPYDLPEEFSHLQAQDMGKLGFMPDLIRGIKKLTAANKPQPTEHKTVVVNNTNATVAPLLRRVFIYLEDGDWQSADEYAEKVLDLEPENAQAYLGKLMAELQVHQQEQLRDEPDPFDDNKNYQKVMRYADDKLKAKLTADIAYINERNENTRLEGIYESACWVLNTPNFGNGEGVKAARRQFVSLGQYKDAEEKVKACDALLLEIDNNIKYTAAIGSMNVAKGTYYKGVKQKNLDAIRQAIHNIEKAKAHFEKLNGYKDSAKCAAECDELKAEYEAAIPQVEQTIQEEREAAEQEARIAAQKAAQKAKKRKRITLISVFSATVIAAAVCVTVFVIIPEVKYSNAQKLYDSGQYADAATTFTALGDYKDSADMAKYAQATELYNNGHYADAATVFAELGNFRDAKERHESALTAYNEKSAEIQKLAAQSLKNASYISAGEYHTAGVKTDGTVVAVGDNHYGQCDVSGWKDIIAVSTGYYHTVGLKADGTVVAVGRNHEGQCDVSDWKDIVAVAVGGEYTVGLKADGTLVAVGNNDDGQCNVSDWKDMIAVSAGYGHTVGLKADGTVDALGYNYQGRCNVTDWKDIIAVAMGLHHTVGLKAGGTVVAVGNNDDGQCDVSGWRDIIAVSAGSGHTVGLKSDGTVVAVGDNFLGQCNVSDWKDIIAVAAGKYHTVGLKADGTTVAVGENDDGQCDVSGWKLKTE